MCRDRAVCSACKVLALPRLSIMSNVVCGLRQSVSEAWEVHLWRLSQESERQIQMTEALLFDLEDDRRVDLLRNWIRLQWAFAHVFWPTEGQIIFMANQTKTLCETVMNECAAEFERHCEENQSHD